MTKEKKTDKTALVKYILLPCRHCEEKNFKDNLRCCTCRRMDWRKVSPSKPQEGRFSQ